jgi:hypothetical protein
MDLYLPHFKPTRTPRKSWLCLILEPTSASCVMLFLAFNSKNHKACTSRSRISLGLSPKFEQGVRFIGIEGLVDAVAKVVPRRSLPNNGVGVDIIIGQKVFLPIVAVLTQLPSMPSTVRHNDPFQHCIHTLSFHGIMAILRSRSISILMTRL